MERSRYGPASGSARVVPTLGTTPIVCGLSAPSDFPLSDPHSLGHLSETLKYDLTLVTDEVLVKPFDLVILEIRSKHFAGELEGEQIIGAHTNTTMIDIEEGGDKGEASPCSDVEFACFKRKKKKRVSKPRVSPVPRLEGPLTLAQVKQEHFDDLVHRGKYIKDILSTSPKPWKKKHSGGSSRSSSKDSFGERKKPKHKSPSPRKAPSGQGK